jgi:hypothetical protein
MPVLSVKDWARYVKELGKQFRPALNRGLAAGAERALTIVQQAVHDAPPASPKGSRGAFSNGDYLRMWKYQVLAGKGVRFYNNHPAAGVIEYGRRAGARRPPSSAVLPWVTRKLGIRGDEAKSVAYVVARAIGERGLQPRRVLENAIPAMQKAIEKEIVHELDLALEGDGG